RHVVIPPHDRNVRLPHEELDHLIDPRAAITAIASDNQFADEQITNHARNDANEVELLSKHVKLSHHRTEVRTPSLQRGKEEEFAQQPAILSGNQLLGVSERVVRGEVPQDDEHLIESTLYILTPHLGRLHSGRNELEGLARVVDEVEQFT